MEVIYVSSIMYLDVPSLGEYSRIKTPRKLVYTALTEGMPNDAGILAACERMLAKHSPQKSFIYLPDTGWRAETEYLSMSYVFDMLDGLRSKVKNCLADLGCTVLLTQQSERSLKMAADTRETAGWVPLLAPGLFPQRVIRVSTLNGNATEIHRPFHGEVAPELQVRLLGSDDFVRVAPKIYRPVTLFRYIDSSVPRGDLVYHAILPALLGTDKIHRAGYVHCDVKPSNIVSDDGARFTIADLKGIRPIDSPREEIVSYAPHYSAFKYYPDGDSRLTQATDIFSWGVSIAVTLGRGPAWETEKLIYDGHMAAFQGNRSGNNLQREATLQEILRDTLGLTAGQGPMSLLLAMTRAEAEKRPPILEVAEELEKLCDRGAI